MKRYLIHDILCLVFCLLVFSNSFAQNIVQSGTSWAADWSADGNWLAVGAENGVLMVYAKDKYQLSKIYNLGATITSIKWHPKENILAATTQRNANKICIIDFTSDKITLLKEIAYTGARGLDWNFNGEYLAVADNEGFISIFDKKGALIRQIKKDNTYSNTALDWHPSKNIFVVLSEKVRLYDLNGDLIREWEHRKEKVLLLCADWHPSGDFFAIGDYGDESNKPLLQFWSPEGNLLKEIVNSKAEYRSIRWNKKGDKIATASDALRIFSKEGTLLVEGKSKDLLWGLDWHPKEKRLVTSDLTSQVSIWNKRAKIKKSFKF